MRIHAGNVVQLYTCYIRYMRRAVRERKAQGEKRGLNGNGMLNHLRSMLAIPNLTNK